MGPNPPQDEWRDAWTDEDRQHFLIDRALFLHKLLTDRQAWRDAPTVSSDDQVTPLIPWTDHAGQAQDTALTSAFLAGHSRVLRAVACDLISCGDEGQILAELLFVTLTRQHPPPPSGDDPPPSSRR